MNLLKNMGSTLIYIAFMASAFILLAVMSVVDVVMPELGKVTAMLQRSILWDSTIRFVY